ncbi:hypothetical protein M011DRAFT_407763 [Sporormia fimetaria CBS 119925]|uniref:Uncharacterized protein n=1 Tax=Sporormia fimetaria CBS 119925 TaxID=1340428 RepID=A0A6A6V4D2_9PLEO|nr:hypothetical protein M011DRAFT_407763 [Sporormia fimetaria CBS 119925]
MGVGETITVINRSGKVVSSSRHILDVFKDAKSAYRERKAEIKAERHAAAQEKKLREGMKALRLEDDTRSRASCRHTHRSKTHRPHDGERRSRSHRFEADLAGEDGLPRELMRRHTDGPGREHPLKAHRSHSESHIDMDLAYGELPPQLPSDKYDDGELREKASKLERLLDEANCLHHSATATIDNLQKNPDALAAVALTLQEISTLVAKMGPSVLPLLKGSFPAVAALLVSPQFMIAAGVGIGVTIVALGGYKIIRKIQQQNESPRLEAPYAAAPPEQIEQLEQLETEELSRIEVWRRGIAEIEADSAGTTVDGEFITPGASRQLVAAGVLDEEEIRSRRKSRVGEDKEHRSRSHRAKSTKSSSKSTASRARSTKESTKTKKKEPSGLRMLFRSHTAH